MKHRTECETPYPGQHVYSCVECTWKPVIDHGLPTWIDYGVGTVGHSGVSAGAAALGMSMSSEVEQ